MAQKRRRNILAQVKGYRLQRSKKKRAARDAIFHAESYAFAHRRKKKGDFRRLWTVRINAALSNLDMKYSHFIKALADKNIKLDRKILATLAKDHPESFTRVVNEVK